MRIQLGSPRNSGHTTFAPAVGDDVLMEDEIVEVAPGQEQEQEDAQSEEGHVVSDESLAVLGITTSEQLIQRLKSKDDIDSNGKSKIYVAVSAFNDTRVPIAKKTILLTDWVLEAIVKNARELPSYKFIEKDVDEAVLAEVVIDDDYWKLLVGCIDSKKLEPADLVMLANKHPLPALLQAYVYFWEKDSIRELKQYELAEGNGVSILTFFGRLKAARTSKQVYQLDPLNQCLASWLSASPLPDHVGGLKEDPDLYSDLTFDLFFQYLTLLEVVLALWLAEASKANNTKKVQDFFLTELLPLHSQALWWLQNGSAKWPTLLLRFRAMINRISYQSLIVPDQFSSTPAAVLKAVADHKGAHIFLWSYLSQLCVQHNDKGLAKSGSAWVKEAEWKRELFQSVISPAIDLIITSGEAERSEGADERVQFLTSLDLLHRAASRFNLHFSDEAHSWRTLLERSVDSILHWHRTSPSQAASLRAPHDKASAFRRGCANALVTIHELDESVIANDRCTQVILCALDRHPYEVGPSVPYDRLLTALCGTSIKSRRVMEFIQSCQDAMDEAIVQQIRVHDPTEKIASETLLRTTMFQKQYWQQSLGIAVRDFVTADQVLQLFASLRDQLAKRCADVQAVATSRKRKASGDMGEIASGSNNLYSKAIVPIYFACALISHVAVSRPAYEAIQACLSSLQADVVCKHLDWTLSGEGDKNCDALATALLKLHESIQQLASACGNEQQGDQSTWNSLATQWDMYLQAYQSPLSLLLTQSSNHTRELLLQAYFVVLNVIARGIERQSTTPFDTLLSGSSEVHLLSESGFHKLCLANSRSPSCDSFDVTHLHGTTDSGCNDIRIEEPAVWSLVGSPYLPIYERMASKELLESIARQFVSLIRYDPPTWWDRESWKLLCCNSSNLELPRWREAVSAELMRALEISVKNPGQHSDHLNLVKTLELFPSDWLPADLRAELSEKEDLTRSKKPVTTFEKGGPLGLTAFRVSTLQTHGFPSRDKSPQAALAAQCRQATPEEYETEVNNYLKALDEGEDNAIASEHEFDEEAGACGLGLSLRSILQTLSLLLCNSPEGTLLVSQRRLTEVIATLQSKLAKEHKSRTDLPGLSCIQFIETVLSTKPILFRSADISAVLSLATQCLVAECGGTDMAPSSSKGNCFTHISTTLIECIRLRRDHMSQYLPQMTMLLVRMIQVFQRGGTRRAGGENHIALEEAKVFGRLLSSITAKSTSTSIGGLAESKIKSLAKSFSTHAPYVIVAFARNMTSPTFARGETREELIRAIYQMCDIVGPWQKNVMMDMLADEAERIVMRSLWRGWEAQRYKGA